MAERDTRFGGNLETANIRPRRMDSYRAERSDKVPDYFNKPYTPSDKTPHPYPLGIELLEKGKNIYNDYKPYIPEVRDDMLNWNVNTDYGRFGVGVGQGKGMLNWSLPLNTSARDTGLGSTNEYQMAELTDKQKEWMRSIGATPDFISPDYSYKHVQGMENKPWDLQWGVQEPTTREEFDEYYNYLLANPSLTSWQT